LTTNYFLGLKAILKSQLLLLSIKYYYLKSDIVVAMQIVVGCWVCCFCCFTPN